MECQRVATGSGNGQRLQRTGAALDDLGEAVTMLEETERAARRVLGGAHPTTGWIEAALREARATLRAREAMQAPRGVGVEDNDDDEDGWETVSSDEEAPTTGAIS